ncbi:MAG: GPP34 family phosphoprotein [Bacteroidetes bacterium]|nr:GPP34 family phosphoprotein [Bacteroidota bacterium]
MDKNDNTTGLSYFEKIILLALDDKGWFGSSEHKIKFGLAGAILYELFKNGRIEFRENVVVLKDPTPCGDPLLDRVLELFQPGKKQRSIRSWIQRIVYKKLMLRKTIIRSLIAKKIVRKEEYNLLWVMYQFKYPLVNHEIKHQVQEELYHKIINDEKLTGEDLMLFVVMDSCKIVRKNFKHFEHHAKVARKIREILQFDKPGLEDVKLLSVINSSIRRAIAASNVSIHA